MDRRYTDPAVELERMGIIGRNYALFTDLDETVRNSNKPIPQKNRRALEECRANGGLVIPISGSPIRYIPFFLRKPIALAEFGAVLCTKTRCWVLASPQEQDALHNLRLFLGLYTQDGVQEIAGMGGEVAVGGPRYASLNLNVGYHPGYPAMPYSAKLERLEDEIELYIRRQPLQKNVTPCRKYHSIDVTGKFWDKRAAVGWLLNVLKPKRSYYMGDGETDLAAMLLPGITAVGFENSCKGIKSLAQIYVDKPGPDGGAAEALEIIQKREQAKLVLA